MAHKLSADRKERIDAVLLFNQRRDDELLEAAERGRAVDVRWNPQTRMMELVYSEAPCQQSS